MTILIIVFWNILFKVCNNACIILRIGKNHFHQFLLSVFTMNDAVEFEDNCFCTILVVIKIEFSIQIL